MSIFVDSGTGRSCSSRRLHPDNGCKDVGAGVQCVCDTDLCNGAVMTSSAGHVIVVVTLVINVVTGYLM